MTEHSAQKPLHVGRPNLGNRAHFLRRVEDILDRQWLSNHGPQVLEFEATVARFLGVKHCVSVCNATVGLEIAINALALKGEVIIPSYTFIATAHALQWQGITPVFADIDPVTHNIDPRAVEKLITPKTTGIIGVHVWGRSCETDALAQIAQKHDLRLMYDASHAFGCSRSGRLLGGNGFCEVFSFHATKFINCLEGGAITTNDDSLAHQLRMMTNFGFVDYDKVEYLGINGKMNEISAAMGLTTMEDMESIIEANHRNYLHYQEGFSKLPGISMICYDAAEHNNYQYAVAEVDPRVCPVDRDSLVKALHEQKILARRYFWPGCHRMQPYRSLQPNAHLVLPHTEDIAARVIVLPTGPSLRPNDAQRIIDIVRGCVTPSPPRPHP